MAQNSDAGVQEGTLLWEPSPERANGSRMSRYLRWLEADRGLTFASYDALWRWSVGDLDWSRQPRHKPMGYVQRHKHEIHVQRGA